MCLEATGESGGESELLSANACALTRKREIYSVLWSYVLCNPQTLPTEKRLVAFIFCNRADMSM
jgi:hypothetical protein